MIDYTETGDAELPPVLLLADRGRKNMWSELTPLLEPWMRSIVPANSADATELLEELGIQEFAVVGFGEGGVVAQELAPRAKTLILLGSPEAPGVDLHELDLPAFLLWGEDDTVVPVETAERMSDALEYSTLALIPECGHDPITDDAATAVPLVYEFLRMRYLGKSHGHAEGDDGHDHESGGPVPVEILTHRPSGP